MIFGESVRYSYYEYGKRAPALLSDASGVPVPNHGPFEALRWREDCIEYGQCGFEDFCVSTGRYWDYDEFETDELWVPCP